ncbi:EEIG family member 2 isoform X1 [Hydra vulgaris]|uniref:Protein FAM102B n=1 Tax=Hydra vulgaris TaxID=6087 RepID=T2MCF8_HYDVU|nr:protein FAM102B [Hydra vulgaris]
MKKRKLKFDVKLNIQELSSIPLLNGVIYCKTRLINGGYFSDHTSRDNVVSHCVKWENQFVFSCKITVSQITGVLENCICRISVRKEIKGGKNYEKLGYVDVNLAEYAGYGIVSRRYILEAYKDSKQHRQDNSMLRITACMTLTSGDPLFKPQESSNDRRSSVNGDSILFSSDFASNYAPTRNSLIEDDKQERKSLYEHNRNPSSGSNKLYSATPSHFRSSSVDKRHSGQPFNHSRQPSSASAGDSGCTDLDHLSPSPIRPQKRVAEIHKRIDETRVDADDIVNQLVQNANLSMDSGNTDEGIEMSMFLDKEVFSNKETNRWLFKPVVTGDRFKTL